MSFVSGKDSETAKKWEGIISKARKSYIEKLWNEEEGFFHFDLTDKVSNIRKAQNLLLIR